MYIYCLFFGHFIINYRQIGLKRFPPKYFYGQISKMVATMREGIFIQAYSIHGSLEKHIYQIKLKYLGYYYCKLFRH